MGRYLPKPPLVLYHGELEALPLTTPNLLGRSVTTGVLQRLDRDADHMVGVMNRVLMVVWRKETRAAAVRRIEERIREHADRCGGSVVYLTVVEPDASMPTAEVRALSAQVLRTSPIRISALAFEGNGFRAAAIRAVVTGIGILARTNYLHRPFATVESATDWIEEETKDDPEGVVGSLVLSRGVRFLRSESSGPLQDQDVGQRPPQRSSSGR